MSLPVSRPVPHGHKMAAVGQHLFLQLRLKTQELTLDNLLVQGGKEEGDLDVVGSGCTNPQCIPY